MRRALFIVGVFLIICGVPYTADGAVVFSEVMYAPEEGTAYEWFELFNDGTENVDLSKWKFSDGSNHVFEKPPKNGGQGSLVIAPSEYVVVAKDAQKFLELTKISGTVIDASFSLTDSGDSLSLIDADATVVDLVTYGENAGAGKNGLSLGRVSSKRSDWTAQTPTPGTGSLSAVSAPSESSKSTPESPQSTPHADFPVEPQIYAFAGKDRVVTVGADTEFNGRATGLKGELLAGARYVWSFGDGERKEGLPVLHRYRYPGEYVVVLEVSSGEYSASDRLRVSALPAHISVSEASREYIELTNAGDRELDLSWWILASLTKRFSVPDNTILLPKSSVRFSSDITELHPTDIASVNLLYPNGTPVVESTLPKSSVSAVEKALVGPSATITPRKSIVGMVLPASPIVNTETSTSVEIKDPVPTFDTLVASPLHTTEKDGTFPTAAVAGLLAILVLGIFSVLFLRRASRDEITLID